MHLVQLGNLISGKYKHVPHHQIVIHSEVIFLVSLEITTVSSSDPGVSVHIFNFSGTTQLEPWLLL